MSNLTKRDKSFLDEIMSDKDRYSIIVDNDAVHIQDNQKSEKDEHYWSTFDQYGYDFVVSLFEYLGFDSDFV